MEYGSLSIDYLNYEHTPCIFLYNIFVQQPCRANCCCYLGGSSLDIYNATKLLPDLSAAFFASLGVVLIIFFRNSLIENKAFIFLAGIFTGILFGISWLTKESVFYLFPFCLALIVIDFRRSLKTSIMFWVGVAAGSLGTLIIEMIVYYTITGDLLFRFHEVERNYRQLENGFFTEGSKFGWAKGDSYYKALLKRLFFNRP